MIVTICGSGRFSSWIDAWHQALTLSGHLVFDMGLPPLKDTKKWAVPEHKEIGARVMRDKVMLSDATLFLNVFGYMGKDTLDLRAFAEKHRKGIYTLESWGKGNGVGPHHVQAWRYAKTGLFGIPQDYMSPVDTARDWHCPFDLLPNPGPLRGSLVKMLEGPREDVIGRIELLQAQGVVPRDY